MLLVKLFAKPKSMETTLKVYLLGSELSSLRAHKQEMMQTEGSRFAFCLNGTISLHQLQQMPDVIFLHQSRNNLFGLKELRKIRKSHPATHIIMVVSPDHIKIARHALNCGALAYLVKGTNEEQQIKHIMELIAALHKEPAPTLTALRERLWSLRSVAFSNFSLTGNLFPSLAK